MVKNDIINTYVRIREIDHTIPDEVLDFMKEAAIEKLNSSKLKKRCDCSKPWGINLYGINTCAVCELPI